MKKKFLIPILFLVALTVAGCGQRVVATGWSGLAATEDIVFLATGPSISALDAKSGLMKWEYPQEAERGVEFYAAPVLTEDQQLIAGGYDSVLYSLNPETGSQRWTFTEAEDRFISPPLITDDGIFATSADHFLYGLDFDGNPLWDPFETGEPIWAAPAYSESCDCLYVAGMDHILYAVDPDNGQLLWKSEDLGGPVVSQPAVSDQGLILLSTFGNEIIAVSEESRAVEWRHSTQDWAWASPLVDGEQVYGSDISGLFFALDLTSGELLWQIQPGGAIVSPPLLVDDMIYFGTDQGALVTVSREGTIQKNQEMGGKIYASPVTNGEYIMVATSEADQIITAYNLNGIKTWGYPPAE